MALSPAEKMRAYRERQKANNQKQVSFLIDADIADTVTSYAEQHQTTQADIFNNLLRQALSGNKLPSNDTVTSYQAEQKELKRKIEILQIKVDNYARDIGNMNRRNTDLEKELRTAKAKKNSLKFDDADKIRLTELCQFFECSLDDALAMLIDNSVKLKFKILDDEKKETLTRPANRR